MDVARFHAALNFISKRYKQDSVDEHFGQLISAIESMSANPSNADIARNFRAELDAFRAALLSSKVNTPPPDVRKVIEELGLDEFLGSQLYSKIQQALEDNQLTPSLASAQLSKLRTEVSKMLTLVVNTDAAFTTLQVPYFDYSDEDAEVEIELPIESETKTLDDLSKEAKDWHRIVDAICETFDEQHTRITIRTLSSGSWLLYLAATPAFIFGVAKCIKGVNLILAEAIKMKDLYAQLVLAKAPKKALTEIEKHNSTKVKTDLEELASQLVAEFYKGQDDGRKHELTNALSQALTRLSHKLANGSKISLRLTPPRAPKIEEGHDATAEQKAALQAIEQAETIQAVIDESEASLDYAAHKHDLNATLPAPNPADPIRDA